MGSGISVSPQPTDPRTKTRNFTALPLPGTSTCCSSPAHRLRAPGKSKVRSPKTVGNAEAGMERGNQQGWAELQHLAQLERHPQPQGSHSWGVAEQNGRRQMWDVWESHANHPSWVFGKGMGGFPEQRRRLFPSSWAEL